MIKINKEVVVIFLIVVLALWVMWPFFEGFDASGSEFVPVGADRYGLRGEPLRRSSIEKYFIRPDRRIRLSQSGGEMWEGNNDPASEGMKDCKKVPCPANGYDNIDTCYKCGNPCPDKFVVPYIHPHVPN